MEVIDYIEDEDGDLRIRNSDFLTGESTEQHQKDLLIADPGQYKIFPTIGVGIDSYLNDDVSKDELERKISAAFEDDGMRVGLIEVKGVDDLRINAEYITNDAQQNSISRR